MIFKAWKKLEEQSIVIKSLWVFVAILIFIVLFQTERLASAPEKMRLYLPPDLSRGASMKITDIPKANVYAFAFQIFTAINSWTGDGTKAYKANIHHYRAYLSPAFYKQLQKDQESRAASGELARTRTMSGVSGMGYKPSDVKVLGNGSWLINMHLHIVETLEGAVIKSIIMDYPLVVTRVKASIQVNPWGFVIAGFNQQPYRIKTIM